MRTFASGTREDGYHRRCLIHRDVRRMRGLLQKIAGVILGHRAFGISCRHGRCNSTFHCQEVPKLVGELRSTTPFPRVLLPAPGDYIPHRLVQAFPTDIVRPFWSSAMLVDDIKQNIGGDIRERWTPREYLCSLRQLRIISKRRDIIPRRWSWRNCRCPTSWMRFRQRDALVPSNEQCLAVSGSQRQGQLSLWSVA